MIKQNQMTYLLSKTTDLLPRLQDLLNSTTYTPSHLPVHKLLLAIEFNPKLTPKQLLYLPLNNHAPTVALSSERSKLQATISSSSYQAASDISDPVSKGITFTGESEVSIAATHRLTLLISPTPAPPSPSAKTPTTSYITNMEDGATPPNSSSSPRSSSPPNRTYAQTIPSSPPPATPLPKPAPNTIPTNSPPKRLQLDLLLLTSFPDNSTLYWRPPWFAQLPPPLSHWTLHNPPNVVTERLPQTSTHSRHVYQDVGALAARVRFVRGPRGFPVRSASGVDEGGVEAG
jgi:hypothetical protein